MDVAVAGLVLNVIPDLQARLREMKRTVRSGGTIAAYVRNYEEEFDLLRLF